MKPIICEGNAFDSGENELVQRILAGQSVRQVHLEPDGGDYIDITTDAGVLRISVWSYGDGYLTVCEVTADA